MIAVNYSGGSCFSEKQRLNVKVSGCVRLRVGVAECGDGMENQFQKNKKICKSLGSTKSLGGNQACLTEENRAISGNGDKLEFSELRKPKQTGI